ncbi:MAG: glycosyltransferase family 2 protein [Bacteroidetes bacterium]|nr:MAG: glycosyltransferase family 2 protein [Bacteroidota bacterium]
MGKNQTPEVSICIPAYNQTTYLKILLDSIARQTFADFEIILSDDSTTPDVKDLAEASGFGGKMKYYKNNPSLGSPANWNAAIEKTSGQYIKIMHHDDALNSPTALEEMMACIKNNNSDYLFCFSAIENVSDPGKNRIHRISRFGKLKNKPYLLFFGNSIGGPSSLLVKNTLKDLKYDTKLIWLVDVEYYIRLLETNRAGNIIAKPLVLTHDAVEHRLTSSILANPELQIKEHASLYRNLSSKAPAITRFFMQVYLTRLFFKFGVKNKELLNLFADKPRLLNAYFSTIKIKPAYLAYRVVITVLDITRKALF